MATLVKSPPKSPPTLVGIPTRPGQPGQTKVSARTKHRRSGSGSVRSHIPKSRHDKPSSGQGGTSRAAANLAPLKYNSGPFTVPIIDYEWRLWAIRGDDRDRVLMTEFTDVSWDDSSAIMTGAVTFQTPEWASKLGLREGHEILCDYSGDNGRNWASLWRMRLLAPNHDLATQARTANLVNDLNRLQQSDDDFVFTKRTKPGGWRVDQIIRYILTKYGFEIATLPTMQTKVTNWHLTDQKPLDVIHSALLRERHATGRKYAISLDAHLRVHITPFRRPRTLYEVGPALLAAVASADHDPRFATALTVRADLPDTIRKDKKGHRKVTHNKIAADVKSDAGIDLYGYIHRNVYSPDAASEVDARKEGKLFLHAIAKPKHTFQATMAGIPEVRRLDAFKVRLPKDGISQIVYVTDAQHSISGGAYTTSTTFTFDDPFVDDRNAKILAKLTDVATARNRKATATSKPKPKPATATPRSKKKPSLVGVQTSPTAPARTAKRK